MLTAVHAHTSSSRLRTLIAALFTFGGMSLAWIAASLLSFRTWPTEEMQNEGLFYAIIMVSYFLVGWVDGRLMGRIRLLPLLLCALLALGVTLVWGRFAYALFPSLFPADPQLLPSDVQRGSVALKFAPLELYLGVTWIRTVSIVSFIALVQALMGASVAAIRPLQGRYLTRFIALRHLSPTQRNQRISRTSAIAAVGVAIGVAALIAVISAMSGYEQEVKEKLIGANAHIVVQKLEREFPDYDEVSQKLLTLKPVKATAPFVFGAGMLSSAGGMYPIAMKGLDVDRAPQVSHLVQQLRGVALEALRPPRVGELPGIILGQKLAEQLGIKAGEELAIVSPIAGEGKRSGAPKRMRFRYVGSFVSGLNEFDQKLSYVGIEAAQKFIDQPGSVTGIEIRIEEPEEVTRVSAAILERLGGWPYRTIDWRQMNHGIFSALKMQKLLMMIILVFIVIVAAFNIASTLLMLIVDKTPQVAVLRTLGLSPTGVMRLFVMEGHVIGLMGVAGGVVLGLALCALLSALKIHIAADVYMVDTLKVSVRPLEILTIAFGSFEIAHLATLYPAARAAKMAPLEALRS